MVNKVILLGNVGGEPTVNVLPSGSRVANISLATSDTWRDKEGNKQTKTEWHKVIIYNENLVRIVEQYVHKGTILYVEGSVRTRKYTDSSGVEKYTTEIIVTNFSDTIKMIGGSNRNSDSSVIENESDKSKSLSEDNIQPSANADMDDEIPF